MYEGLVEWYATVAAGSAFEYRWKPVVTGFWRMRYISEPETVKYVRPRLEDDIGQAIVSVDRTRRERRKSLYTIVNSLPSTNVFLHHLPAIYFTKHHFE